MRVGMVTTKIRCVSPRRIVPPEQRFWPKVDKNGPVSDFAPHLGPCWIWTAGKNRVGYGKFSIMYDTVPAHQFAYRTLVGPVPAGLQLDHLCMVPACVNPSHLEPVTFAENVGRSPKHPRNKTHCKHGHPLSGDNLMRLKCRNERVCKTCSSNRKKRYAAEAKASRTTLNPGV